MTASSFGIAAVSPLTRRGALVTAGASLAALLANPDKLRAATSALELVTLTTMSGAKVVGAVARPAKASALTVVIIHEWWGLNDQIKAVAATLAEAGHTAVAVDLMNGSSTDDPAKAKIQMAAVTPEGAGETLHAWMIWARQQTAKVATLGFCFGGGWSLNASLADPADGTVIYYGNVDKKAGELATLKGPVLGHFASRDGYISPDMVHRFQEAMKAAGKRLTAYSYDADHGFANPTTARYDAPDAQMAWSRTAAFLGTL